MVTAKALWAGLASRFGAARLEDARHELRDAGFRQSVLTWVKRGDHVLDLGAGAGHLTLAAALREIHRVLRPGGRVFIKDCRAGLLDLVRRMVHPRGVSGPLELPMMRGLFWGELPAARRGLGRRRLSDRVRQFVNRAGRSRLVSVVDGAKQTVLNRPVPIREAILADARTLAEVHVAAWKVAYRGLLPSAFLDGLTVESRLERWKFRLAQEQTQVLVWEDEGRLVGFCVSGASRDQDANSQRCGEIQAIYLLQEAWGKGKGAALCKGALDSLRRQGFNEATLWVLRQNARARAFYERMGFAPDGASEIKRREPGVELDELRYRCALL